ncbi:ChaN family lipoprotein [Tellurirhabdus rosea]|uniref:ChaN family lipoprotein n=1 Tax=Tellurirhabdus rosea TaxID=2674997 RepID=UPI00225A44BE|nr:ChaN family lipoprotein [Tellurirhabdus rosea]
MRNVLLLCCFLFLSMIDKPAYVLYNQKLKPASYDKLLKQAAEADVVLFGELHNNPICHWLELQLAKDLYAAKKAQLIYGAEMFETDNQPGLTQYLSGQLSDEQFRKDVRLWQNYDTDYRPLVEFAKKNTIPFVATNVPRRYASTVARQGLAALDPLPANEKAFIAPLPLTVDLNLPGYKAMLGMMGGHGNENPHGAASEAAANFARAQAIKDATMADRILKAWSPGKTMLHFNGDYHSKNFEGIVWYLRQQNPNLKIVTLSSFESEDITRPEKSAENLADFVLAIPADMTKTY